LLCVIIIAFESRGCDSFDWGRFGGLFRLGDFFLYGGFGSGEAG
jgi:hypothetical protein